MRLSREKSLRKTADRSFGFAVDGGGCLLENPTNQFRSIPKKCHRGQAGASREGLIPDAGDGVSSIVAGITSLPDAPSLQSVIVTASPSGSYSKWVLTFSPQPATSSAGDSRRRIFMPQSLPPPTLSRCVSVRIYKSPSRAAGEAIILPTTSFLDTTLYSVPGSITVTCPSWEQT